MPPKGYSGQLTDRVNSWKETKWVKDYGLENMQKKWAGTEGLKVWSQKKIHDHTL